jgi:biotin transport system substrate-specific component
MNSTNTLISNSNIQYKVIKVLLGVVAMAAASNIAIHMKPVDITFNTVMIMAIGLTYSRIEAFSTIAAFITVGAMGAPVFTNFGSTIAYMMGPSGGYILGYLIAVCSMTYMREKFALHMLYNCMLGHMLIYIPGILWLSTFIGMEVAIYKGFIIYIPTGILKIGVLVGLMHVIKRK